MSELEVFDMIVLRKLGTLCHNRQATEEELGKAMDADPRRARDWLRRLRRLGLVERDGVVGAFTWFPTPGGWETLQTE